jgi:anti-sigma factor RsiW
MKTFEEKWTAWLDGQLTGKDLAEFEASLPDISAAALEKQETLKLGAFLRKQIGAPVMKNAEFFHHQLQGEIEREARSAAPARPVPKARETWWSIGRLVWTGAASLAIFSICAFFVMRDRNAGGQSAYLTQIINARVDPAVSPNATISIFERQEDKVTVIWVDGLQSLPSEYAAK